MQEIKNTIFFLVGLLLGLLLALLLPALICLYLLAAPYTKAEESFNLQATHDIVVHVVHGTPLFGAAAYHLRASYDHFTFPGTVPRTFTGAFLLAAVSKESFDVSGELDGQRIVRGFLGFANAFALFLYSCALSNAFGFGVGNWYTLLQASQFHVLFYASRTLPNTFAFGLTTLAATALVPVPQTWSPDARARAQKYAIYFLVTAGVVFRAEIALLLGGQVLFLLGMQQASLRNVVVAGATGAAIALAVSVPLDSYFWQRLVLLAAARVA
jgi:alpha-1,6-mannosyltransferase